jgi:hypothetical protein
MVDRRCRAANWKEIIQLHVFKNTSRKLGDMLVKLLCTLIRRRYGMNDALLFLGKSGKVISKTLFIEVW